MHKVSLSFNRLAALAVTSVFCLLTTSCGEEEGAKDDAAKLRLAEENFKAAEAKIAEWENLSVFDLLEMCEKGLANVDLEKGIIFTGSNINGIGVFTSKDGDIRVSEFLAGLRKQFKDADPKIAVNPFSAKGLSVAGATALDLAKAKKTKELSTIKPFTIKLKDSPTV